METIVEEPLQVEIIGYLNDLCHDEYGKRQSAIYTLCRINPMMLREYAQEIVQMFKRNPTSRAVIVVLSKLDAAVLDAAIITPPT